MTAAVLSALAAVIVRLSPRGRAAVGRALGVLAGSVLRIRRSLVESAMDRAGIGDPRATAGAMYGSLGLGLVELLWLARAGDEERDAVVQSVTIDEHAARTFDDALDRGPVVLLASHTGNWELAAAAAARLLAGRGRKLAVVAKVMRARGVDAFLARLRARLGLAIISPRGAFGAARKALARGDVVVMPIDQVPDRAAHALPVRFLGETALVDRAPATLAWRARATVLVVAAERIREAHHVRVLEAIAPAASAGRRSGGRAWIDATTEAATFALESFVRRSPETWMWLHRRWRAPRVSRRDDKPGLPLVPSDEAS